MTMTEAQLIGSPEAFRELYERYAERIHGYHLRRTRNPDAAHDLTAETFAQAWTSRRRFCDEAGGSVGPWLHGIARNVLLESVRRGQMERAACAKLGVFERLDREPADAFPEATWLDGLDEALAELPNGERAAVELRVLHDLDYDRVAAALSTSTSTAAAGHSTPPVCTGNASSAGKRSTSRSSAGTSSASTRPTAGTASPRARLALPYAGRASPSAAGSA